MSSGAHNVKQEGRQQTVHARQYQQGESEMDPEKQFPCMSGERLGIFLIIFDIFQTSCFLSNIF